MKRTVFLTIIIFFNIRLLSAQTDTLKLKLDFPFFDFPYQNDAKNTVGNGFFSGYANPGMTQSLAVSTNVYSVFHYGMKKLSTEKKMWGNIGIALGDLLLFYSPGGDGWLHEEFHRAVMTRFGVNSFNGMNKFPIGKEIISVNKVKDEGLARMKAESSPDFIRMHVAGIEGQYLLVDRLQRNNFFYDQDLPHELQYLMSTLNSIIYVMFSSRAKSADANIDELNSKESSIRQRDFTGFDMTSWAYDLFRPDEPYEDRGIHPSGTGIDRYRKTIHLNKNELNYLKWQGVWQWTNILSPMLLGIRSVNLGSNGLSGNFAFRHYLTSFGTDLSLNVFLKNSNFNRVFAYHNYRNHKHFFHAIETEHIDYPIIIGNKMKMFLSYRMMLGIQPKDQSFKTSKSDFFGLIGGRVDFRISDMFYPYLDLSSKTKGWVAGNEFLNDNTNVKIGLSLRVN